MQRGDHSATHSSPQGHNRLNAVSDGGTLDMKRLHALKVVVVRVRVSFTWFLWVCYRKCLHSELSLQGLLSRRVVFLISQ